MLNVLQEDGEIMELTINKEDLNAKLVALFTNNVAINIAQQGLDEEEVNAHMVINRKKIQADADQVTNLVFSAYGVVDTPTE